MMNHHRNPFRSVLAALALVLGLSGVFAGASVLVEANAADIGAPALEAPAADAAVTNCSWYRENWSGSTRGRARCTSTTANPPYTTQWAEQGYCLRSDGAQYNITTGWWNVGTAYRATPVCQIGYTAQHYTFVFR